MANSKLLKEAIADAKAVKETALANAKIALEEAFTPRLQSILSKKLQAEAEEEEDKDQEQMAEELDSSEIGTSDANKPKEPAGFDADTELGPDTEKSSAAAGAELEDHEKVKDLNEEESDEDEMKSEAEDEEEIDINMDSDEEGDEEYEITGDEEEDTEEADEDEMDLEAIIRELESQIGDEDSATEEPATEGDEPEMKPAEDEAMYEDMADGSEAGTDKGEDPKVVVTTEEEEKEDDEEVIDLEEILREMEADLAGDKKEDETEKNEMKKSLKEAYNTIHSLRKTLNEVNLLNAKLLFANKLFRAHNMTNEQKVKVIETLDRTKSVREVKLVYATLAENFKYTGTNGKVTKKSITEGIASKVVKSTKPAAAKQVIAEGADFSARFKKLAGIIK
jgi:hypothetical protein